MLTYQIDPCKSNIEQYKKLYQFTRVLSYGSTYISSSNN